MSNPITQHPTILYLELGHQIVSSAIAKVRIGWRTARERTLALNSVFHQRLR